MNIKPLYIYELKSHKKAYIIYYSIIIGFTVLTFLFSLHIKFSNGRYSVGDINFGPALQIFTGIIGLNIFRDNFQMSLQNGISRKSFFSSTVFGMVTLCFTAGFLNLANLTLSSAFEYINGDNYKRICFTVEKLYNSTDVVRYDTTNFLPKLQMCFEEVLFTAMAALFFMTLGFAIASIMYRLTKTKKIIFFAVDFVSFLIIQGFFSWLKDQAYSSIHGLNYNEFGAFVYINVLYPIINTVFNLMQLNPYTYSLLLFICCILFALISWLFTRKMQIKTL